MRNKLHYHNLGVSEVFVFDQFLINQIKPGELVDSDQVKTLKHLIQVHFSDREMVYLSNRVFTYSVNPMVYNEVVKIPNLLGMGIVVHTDSSRLNAQFEKSFYTKPFAIFDNVPEAVYWAQEVISNYHT